MNAIINTGVVILGGGAAGVAAATAAARKGANVVLVEKNNFLGGKATAAEVGTICGLYKFSNEQASYIVKGFAKEFAEQLQERSATAVLSNAEGLHFLPYDVEVFKSICEDLLKENKVKVLLNSSLNDVEIKNGLVASATVRTSENLCGLSFSAIIDCSGDSIISQAANLPVIQDQHYQAAAQVFTMQNVEEENEARLGMILMKALRSAIDQKQLPDFYDRVYIVQGSLKEKKVSLKIGIPVAVTYEKGNLEAIKESAKEFIETLTGFLIQHIPVFKHASVEHIASETGIRVGRRTQGNYILTGEDVLGCKKFPDAIANCSWPIEEWEQQRRVKMRYFNMNDFYQIPAGCLQSGSIKNLFMAGRNISADNDAIASARVMGICLQTGYAAGCMGAGYALNIAPAEALSGIQHEQL